jgi:hypothetical protein
MSAVVGEIREEVRANGKSWLVGLRDNQSGIASRVSGGVCECERAGGVGESRI